MGRKYFIETYGCQMNVHDSERLAGLLDQAGYESTEDDREADLIVINTCSVRERAEDRLYTRLGEIGAEGRRRGGRPLVAVAGCVAQQEGKALLRRSPAVDVVIGTQSLLQLPALLDRARGGERAVDINPHDDVSFPLGLARRGDPVKAYVTIIEGCNDYCSFCIVPYTRGHERMRPVQEILAEVREAVDSGRREVQLLGQIVNHYAAPDRPNVDFAALLELVSGIPGVERIRFASPHPRHVTRRLIEAYRDLPAVCEHIHLPVQSGSNRVLAAMRRRHTREEYLDTVAQLRAAVEGLAISTDIIVGFPGETREDFHDTLALVESVRFSGMFSFKYSERPGTLAVARMSDDVDDAEKTARIVVLQALQRRIQTERHEAMVGRTFEVLIDGRSRRREWELSGRTAANTVVNLPGDPRHVGQLVPVSIRRAGPNSVWGEMSAGVA